MQRKVKLYHYQLPLDCAMILRGQSLDVREGWIIELYSRVKPKQEPRSCPEYAVGRGEIAPLPGFSHETLAQAKQQLEHAIKTWLAQGIVDLSTYCPAVAFGFSMALLELEDGLPQTVDISSHYHHPNSALLLAADLGVVNSHHTALAESRLCKLKIAKETTVDAAEHDGEITRQLLGRYPQLGLRLDANQRWSLAAALAFAAQIPPQYRQRIAFIEEPCETAADCLRFADETGIAIAWDESLRAADPWQTSRHSPEQGALKLLSTAPTAVKAIVIKPMLTGTVEYCMALIEQAHQQSLAVVISSSLESSFGLHQLARLAQSLTPDSTPGLDTVNVFTQQLVEPWPHCSLPLIPLSQLAVTYYAHQVSINHKNEE